ncbi:TPA: membrane lipoprotein lipid attachment site-containing protein [Campylobacter jejuni]|nr:membrane lipoprotein lipid attachment site-containing protein [Campylobacter jejuni]HEC1843632.1 membrane lipoprotein lipid attachment site-containing protein [Campylobacter jejuni]HEG1421625.1 membrane lipoprotein lipid attachment site-containing protein [Campylobacter jejuni]HEG1422131.1 membrane lipoprotein lipid attachment site-containing protein [Campylobacter jejuni]HEG2982238.1 membrane lipoprotein lipid attachment site-containing protein [Campylobacter jejuni]
MKKYILLASSMLILAACGGTSSNFVNVSMPNFKPQVPTKVEPIDSGVSIALEPINIEQNNNYSDYFENSVLKIRIEKEIDLLKQNLEEQIKTIAQLKGYKIVTTNPDYTLKSSISIYTEEKNAQKTSNFMSGDYVKSNLGINFKGKIDFIDAHNPQNSTNLSSSTKLDSLVALNYPIKNDDGVNMFKTTISTVPTQLNKGLEQPAFEIDKSFLAFYKNTLNTLYNNLPKATDIGKTIPNTNSGFNSFDGDATFEENLPQTNSNQNNTIENTPTQNIPTNPSSTNQNNQSKNQDGVEIFE